MTQISEQAKAEGRAMTDKDEPLFGCSDEFCASEVSYPASMLATGPDGRRWCEHCYDEHLPDWDEETPPWELAPKFVPQFQALIEWRCYT